MFNNIIVTEILSVLATLCRHSLIFYSITAQFPLRLKGKWRTKASHLPDLHKDKTGSTPGSKSNKRPLSNGAKPTVEENALNV